MTARPFAWALVLVATFLILALVAPAPAAAFPERTAYDREWPALGRGDFVIADLTGDGFDDLAAVDDAAGVVRVYTGSRAGISQTPGSALAVRGAADLATADMNGDGQLDLVAAGGIEGAWFRWVAGSPASLEARTFPIDGSALSVAPGDFDGDGDTDLAVLSANSARVSFQFNGGFQANDSLTLTTNEAFEAIAAEDVDGDGREDIVLAKAHETRVYLQRESGPDLNPVSVGTQAISPVSLGTIRRPGSVPYIAVVGAVQDSLDFALGLWHWDSGNLHLAAEYPSPFAPWLAVADLNGDDRSDVVRLAWDGKTDLLYQRGWGELPSVPDVRLTGAADPEGHVAIGDVNGEGFRDVVVRLTNPDRFVAYLQEDAPPFLLQPIPSTFSVNRGSYVKAAVNLRAYFEDDHNELTFEVVSASNESLLAATVEGSALNFQASADAYGVAEFRVAAWDGNPGHVSVEANAFEVIVNDPPAIASQPVLRATEGQLYAYVMRVADAYPEGDRHSFALLDRPAGMSIDPATGLVTWTPTGGQSGSHEVSAAIRDDHGGAVLHAFTVVVAPGMGGPMIPLIVFGFIGTSAALMAAAALINENAKWAFLLFVLPLYSKIKRERVLDHFVRGQIFGYIQANPGEHYNAIKDALGLTNGSLAHHLRTLEREQFVKSRRFGLYRRFYPMHYRIPEQDVFQPNDVQRTILDAIRHGPGITQKEIATHLNLTPPTVNYHIAVLSERRLIRVERRGRSTHCSIIDGPT